MGSPSFFLAPGQFERTRHVAAARGHDGHTPHTHVGLFGVGLAAVNALSERFTATIEREGGKWTQAYQRGRPSGPLRRIGTSRSHGTTIRLKPDEQVFATTELSFELIRTRLRELAGLAQGLRWHLRDERRRDVVVRSPQGLAALLSQPRLTEREVFGAARLETPIVFHRHDDLCTVDAAITWRYGRGMQIDSFVNLQRTRGGGVRVAGLIAGLKDAQRGQQKLNTGNSPDWATAGLHAVIHARISTGTSFANPARDKLTEPDISSQVRRWVREAVTQHLVLRPQHLQALVSPT